MTAYFYGKQIPYNIGDNVASSSSISDTTLKLVAPEGYYDGDDTVTITDAEFIAGNIKDTANIFGLAGTISVKAVDQTATTSSVDGTTLKFTVPEGFYDGTINVTKSDENFIASNIKDGVTVFGLSGTLVGGDYQLIKTGQTTSLMTNDDGDLERGLVVVTRYTDNEDNTITDNVTGFKWIKNPIIVCNGQTLLSAKGTWSESSVSYSAGDVVQYPPVPTTWAFGTLYTVGTKVTGEMGGVYRCIQEHTSDYDNNAPEYGATWTDYWVLDNYPTATAWADATSYTVGNEVSVSEMGVTEVYICIKAHTSSYETIPGPMGGANYYDYWILKNDKYVCISSHTSEMAKAPTNATYWVEAPFTGSADNLTTERTMTWNAVMYQVNKLTYLSESWLVPNINELQSLVDYSESPTRNDLFTGISASGYWSSTKSGFSEYGETNCVYLSFNKGEVGIASNGTLIRPIFYSE